MKNLKATKKILFTNVMSLFICVIMLIGTTFAWFTDNATTNVNTIKAGTLKVGLSMLEGDTWKNAEGTTLSFKALEGTALDSDGNILWEPGATFEIPELKIVNNGTLAIKFKVMITGITGDIELADVIDVYKVNEDSTSKLGTLSQLMNDANGAAYGSLLAGEETEVYKLAFRMQEVAGNMYQGKGMENITVTVVATQDTVESDSYNNTYDENSIYPEVMNTEVLQDSIRAGKNVEFTSNVSIEIGKEDSSGYGKTGINQMNGGVIDGNGNTLHVDGSNSTWDSAITTSGGTIKNLAICSGFRGIFVTNNKNNNNPILIDNVIIDGPVYTISCDTGNNEGLVANNSTFNGWTSYSKSIGNVKFTNCRFGEGSGYKFCRPYAETLFVSCDFSEGYQIDTRYVSGGITLVDCKLNGVLITEDNVSQLIYAGTSEDIIIKNTVNN